MMASIGKRYSCLSNWRLRWMGLVGHGSTTIRIQSELSGRSFLPQRGSRPSLRRGSFSITIDTKHRVATRRVCP